MRKLSIITIEAVPDAIRGTLTRWMIEPVTGVFVGELPKKVREEVWKMIIENSTNGRSCFISPEDNEQKMQIRTHGETNRTIQDFDGIFLISIT